MIIVIVFYVKKLEPIKAPALLGLIAGRHADEIMLK